MNASSQMYARKNAAVPSPFDDQPAVQYDHRGRLQPYVETSAQRRARAEFLRRRDFSQRINAWISSSSTSSPSTDTDALRTIDEEDEREVIYSTAPAVRPLSRHLRASSRTSSLSSLSSISEESV